MIPTAFVIPTMTASSGMAALFGPAAVLGLGAMLVTLGVLVARLAVEARPERAPRAMPETGSRFQVLVRRAA